MAGDCALPPSGSRVTCSVSGGRGSAGSPVSMFGWGYESLRPRLRARALAAPPANNIAPAMGASRAGPPVSGSASSSSSSSKSSLLAVALALEAATPASSSWARAAGAKSASANRAVIISYHVHFIGSPSLGHAGEGSLHPLTPTTTMLPGIREGPISWRLDSFDGGRTEKGATTYLRAHGRGDRSRRSEYSIRIVRWSFGAAGAGARARTLPPEKTDDSRHRGPASTGTVRLW